MVWLYHIPKIVGGYTIILVVTSLNVIDDFLSALSRSKVVFQYFFLFSVPKYSYCCNAGMNVA
mgnify:CR=1 FL=1